MTSGENYTIRRNNVNNISLFFQHIFVLNIAANDVFLALISTIRGLGYLHTPFVGATQDGTTNSFCQIYAIALQTANNSILPVLMPLTIDRFVSIVFPTQYATIVSKRVSVVMVLGSWVPSVVTAAVDTAVYLSGYIPITFHQERCRCAYDYSDYFNWMKGVRHTVFFVAPMVLLSGMYLVMVYVIVRRRIMSSRLLLTSLVVILTGIISTIPLVFSKFFGSYEVKTIMVVTLPYTNCILDPLVYFVINPRVQEQVSEANMEQFVVRARRSVNENRL